MLAALDSRGPASLPASQNTPAPTATTFSTSNVAAPSEPESAPVSEPESEPESEPASVPEPGPESEPESRVGGQTNKQPTITAAAGTQEYCHIEPENMHNDVVTNLGDEKLLATKLQKSKTAEQWSIVIQYPRTCKV